MRQAGQKVLPKKTGMEPKAARFTSIPVEMQFPVLGQRIMTMPIVLFGTAASSRPGGKNGGVALRRTHHLKRSTTKKSARMAFIVLDLDQEYREIPVDFWTSAD